MQAQVMRLEAVSDRVSTLAGGRVDARPADKPAAPAINMGVGSGLRTPGAAPAPGGANLGRGGPAPAYSAELTVSDFQRELDKLTRTMESRFDQLQAAEAQMLWTKIAAKRMPTLQPVNVGYNISSFGWRIDPINGRGSMHEGIDFVAPEGTAVFAAADGIVIAAENHHSYGQMLEVDHGSDLITRYAHNSKHLVAVGALVKRGQKIAEVGNTGRSTGSHLHFEVRIKGTAIDPSKFLQAGSNQTPASQQAAAATVQKLAAEVRANSAANGAPGSTTAAGK
jgi:murein DD-endopeptidase MepM/ murein hydrolase activator NlpD